MTTEPNKPEISMEELAEVAGGSKNIDNAGVKTAIDAFNKTVKAGQTLELARSSGCLGPADGRFGHE